MSEIIEFYAGKKAYNLIKENGLSPDMVDIVAGASGGPKWLILSGIDRAIFSYWFKSRVKPLHLIGSSIGSWRFAAAATQDIEKSILTFEEMYINQRYSLSPSKKEVSEESLKILKSFVSENIDYILGHPFVRLNVISVRNRFFPNLDNTAGLLLLFAGATLFNIISRKSLGLFFQRILFHSHEESFFSYLDDFNIETTGLSKDNLIEALLSSGSIPFVMEGVSGIDGLSKGICRDGGIIDYHLDIPYKSKDSIVLYPHFFSRIVPGWLDKSLRWRKPLSENMENVLLVCPSQDFVDSLPYAKIPDRDDFNYFKGRDSERIKYWQSTVEKNRALGDEFIKSVESGKIKSRLKKLDSK